MENTPDYGKRIQRDCADNYSQRCDYAERMAALEREMSRSESGAGGGCSIMPEKCLLWAKRWDAGEPGRRMVQVLQKILRKAILQNQCSGV